jgi:hypothetical protein
VCVCLLLQDLVQSCLRGGGGGYGRTCATRDDEPRPAWTRLAITHKLLGVGEPSKLVCVEQGGEHVALLRDGGGQAEQDAAVALLAGTDLEKPHVPE